MFYNSNIIFIKFTNKEIKNISLCLFRILIDECLIDFILGAQAFSRKHPMSCWLSYMLVVFAGGMLCNGLLGEPIIAPFKNTGQIIVACAVWYFFFFFIISSIIIVFRKFYLKYFEYQKITK